MASTQAPLGTGQRQGSEGAFATKVSQVPWVALTVICGICLIVEMGSLVTAPMMTTLETALNITSTQALWATLAPLLVAAATTAPLGKLGDMYGHRRVLIGVLLLGLAGNIVTAVSSDVSLFLLGRSLLGFTGSQGLMLAILRDRTPRTTQRRGVGVIAGIQGIGIAVGFMVGGAFISSGASWRTVFWFLAVLSLVGLLSAIFLLPESTTRAKVKFDWIGLIGLAAALCLIDVAISQSGTWGWHSGQAGKTWGFLIGGIVLLVLWYEYLRFTKRDPMIDPKVLVHPKLMPMFLVYACMSFAALALWTGLSNFAQVPPEIAGYGFGYSLFEAGLVILPSGIMMGLCGLFFGGVVNKTGVKAGTVLGQLGLALIFLVFTLWHHSVWVFLIGGPIYAIFSMFVFTASFSVILSMAPKDSTAIVSSILQVISGVASNIGVAVFVASITANFVPGTPIPAESGYTRLWAIVIGVQLLGFLLALTIPRGVAKGAFDPGAKVVTVDQETAQAVEIETEAAAGL